MLTVIHVRSFKILPWSYKDFTKILQILQDLPQIHQDPYTLWLDTMTKDLTTTSWVIFFKVLSVNK